MIVFDDWVSWQCIVLDYIEQICSAEKKYAVIFYIKLYVKNAFILLHSTVFVSMHDAIYTRFKWRGFINQSGSGDGHALSKQFILRSKCFIK